MPTYVLPQVLVYQDFQILPSVVANPLRAHISGGHAFLIRYDQATEREFGRLDYYDNAVDTPFLWPNRPAGGVVDNTYVKLWIKDALLRFFEHTGGRSLGRADGEGISDTIRKVGGYNNRIRSEHVNFKTNGVYGRFSELMDRDVALGDTIKLRAVPAGSDPITMWTYVRDLIGDIDDESISAPTSDTANADDNVTLDVTVTQEAGTPVNCVTATADADDYDGSGSGYINETYIVKVLESSVGGDFSTARLRVISASGTDDVRAVTPNPAGEATEIGTRGLKVTFDLSETAALSQSATNDSVNPDDLIAGQEWRVVIRQAWAAPVLLVDEDNSLYDSYNDTTYIVEVVEGGAWDSSPRVMVSTVNGVDMSGPTVIHGYGIANAFEIGSLGVSVYFDETNTPPMLRTGDRYFVEVIGKKEGPMRTIALGHNLPAEVDTDTPIEITLFIRKPLLQVPENRIGFAPQVNWECSETEFTVKEGIIAYDETWTDEGVPEPLDVSSESGQDFGLMYVEYRAWRSELAHEVGTISDVGEINDLISGALDPDNPLKWGVFRALTNSNGTEVKYTAVNRPDMPEQWADVLELLLGRDDVYGLVPLTRNRIVLDLYAAHVKSMSSPEQGLWRVLWLNLEGKPEIPIVHAGSTVPSYIEATTSDGEVCKCTFTDDPLTSGNQYTIMQCPAGNGLFIRNNVRPGDIVRTLWVSDGFGNETPMEYVVDEVQSEDQIRLMTGPSAPQTTAIRMEIWRNLTATEEAGEIARSAGSWNHRRIRAVWPDRIEAGGTIMEGYHLCAALAGETSGVLPHQGLTHLGIGGFSDVSRTTRKFNRPQLDIMAVAGVWIVTQDMQTGKIFTRHAVTTGDYTDINQREEMLTRNVDSISYRFKDHFAPYIGVTNVTPSMRLVLENDVKRLVDVLKWERFTQQLGGQLIDATIRSLIAHPTIHDRFVLYLDCQVPYAMNNFEVHLVI